MRLLPGPDSGMHAAACRLGTDAHPAERCFTLRARRPSGSGIGARFACHAVSPRQSAAAVMRVWRPSSTGPRPAHAALWRHGGPRAAQPASAITQKDTNHRVQLLATIGGMRCGRQPSGERTSWRWSRWRHRSPPGYSSKPPTEPRPVTRPPRPAGGCAKAPTSCSVLVAGRWPTGPGSGRSPPSHGQNHRRNQTGIMVGRRPRRSTGFASSGCCHPRGHTAVRRRHPRLRRTWSDPWC
jgi:hypothetical protein